MENLIVEIDNGSITSKSIASVRKQYSTENSTQELSELGFFSQIGIGVKNEWEVSIDIYAFIIATSEKKTVLKCAINKEKNEFQNRIFDTQSLSKVISPKRGQVVLIRQRQGVVNNEYQNLLSFADGNGMIENPEVYFNENISKDNELKFDISFLGDII